MLEDGAEKINNCLTKLNEWCIQNKLTINISKTKFMIMHKPNCVSCRHSIVPDIIIGESKIENVKVFKYLGIHIDSCLTFKTHYNYVDKRTSVAISKVHGLKRYFDVKMLKHVFQLMFVA